MTFVLEKITQEELLSKFPEKYSVLKNHFPWEERRGFPMRSWIVDRDRGIYVFLMCCGEGMRPDVYLILFWGESYVLAKDDPYSMFHYMGGRVVPEVWYISEEIRGQIEEIEIFLGDAFNDSGWFGSSNDVDVSLAFPKAT